MFALLLFFMFCSFFQFSDKEIGNAGEQMVSGVSAIDTMISVGIGKHHKWFVCLNQCLGIFGNVAEVYVVVGHTMTDQQASMQLSGT